MPIQIVVLVNVINDIYKIGKYIGKHTYYIMHSTVSKQNFILFQIAIMQSMSGYQ